MNYNQKSIKKFKGQLILMTFKNKINEQITQTGIITASTKYHVLFDVNNEGREIILNYENILNVEKPWTYF